MYPSLQGACSDSKPKPFHLSALTTSFFHHSSLPSNFLQSLLHQLPASLRFPFSIASSFIDFFSSSSSSSSSTPASKKRLDLDSSIPSLSFPHRLSSCLHALTSGLSERFYDVINAPITCLYSVVHFRFSSASSPHGIPLASKTSPTTITSTPMPTITQPSGCYADAHLLQVVFFSAAAMLCKEQGVTLLGVCLVLEMLRVLRFLQVSRERTR